MENITSLKSCNMKYSPVDHCLLSRVHHSPICSSSCQPFLPTLPEMLQLFKHLGRKNRFCDQNLTDGSDSCSYFCLCCSYFGISGCWIDSQPTQSQQHNLGKYFWKRKRFLDSEEHVLSLRKEPALLMTVGNFSKHKPGWEANLLYFSLPLNVVRDVSKACHRDKNRRGE